MKTSASVSRDPLGSPSLLGFLWAHWEDLRLALAARIFGNAVLIAFPFLTKWIIDDKLSQGDLRGVVVLTLWGLFFLLLHILGTWVAVRLLARIVPRLMQGMRARIFQKLQFMHFGFLDQVQTGRLLAKYAFDTQKIEASLFPIVHLVLPEAVRAGVMLFALAWIDPWTLLFVVFMVPIFVGLRAIFFSGIKERNRVSRLAEARLTGQANEFISALRLVRGFGQEQTVHASLEEASRDYTEARRAQILVDNKMGLVTFSLVTAINLLAISCGAILALKTGMTIGTLVAFVGALPAILQPIMLFTQFSQQYFLARESYHSIKELIDSGYVEEWRGTRLLEPMRGEIEFVDVGFSYDPAKGEILRGLNFKIRPGEHLAVVGPSGSGKSTLINLLLGLYAPTVGEIRIDSVPQRELAMRALRQQCAIVMQENVLFSGTLLENIRFGRVDASMEEVEEAARLANCLEFIRPLRDGFETVVGERGVSLSGGQRQRLAIARAILRDPRLLILDEATSALDYESERLVQEALERLAHGRTTITIAHRLSTVRKADRILVLRDGEVLETGTYAELAQRSDSYFHELLAAQG